MVPARAHRSLVAVLVLCAVALLCAGAGHARAGTWTLIGCTQPNGAPAPTDGWTAGWWAGGPTLGSGDTNSCATPGGALSAASSQNGAAYAYTGPEWVFNAPGGAAILGGSISATLSAPQGEAWIGTPGPAYDGADVIANCQQGSPPCQNGATESGTFPISHPGGTSIYAPALCATSSIACTATGSTGVNAQVAITQAEIELAVEATPTARNFSGSLLSHGANGTADLVFTASDPGASGGFGPGVYGVTVQLDGRTVYSGVPDTYHGDCVALGTDPATGGLMFDHGQPCAPLAKLTIPVQTSALSDGRHPLTVAMSDAAGETATVLQRSISTFNPVTSPLPHRPREVDAQVTTGWTFAGSTAQLDSVRVSSLPKHTTVSAACTGRRCPALRPSHVTVARLSRLWSALKRATFHAGDRLQLTIRARHLTPEPIEFRIRAGRRPTARLLRSP
jgi:hypothetical protein